MKDAAETWTKQTNEQHVKGVKTASSKNISTVKHRNIINKPVT